ncbi:MAG TPA: hypothetical protein DET40_14635 [Lentisphaeria bacterium]|nr:MAG: hypothetical protein A2X45_05805 [Lentisphaerae bacterium GWF2_50_93]HCE44775.1 hypothetical protein [Lentisphaeria bacterium]
MIDNEHPDASHAPRLRLGGFLRKAGGSYNKPWYKWDVTRLREYGVLGWILYVIIGIFIAIVAGVWIF